MVGWATQGGATTGGSGTPVVATTLAQLNGYLDESITPQIIHVKGLIEGQVTLDGTANKTIIGCGATLRGGIMMEEAHNIIVQNLKITNPFDFGDSDAAASLESIGDVMTDCTGTTAPKGTAFKPPYPYTAEPTADLEARIRTGAGVR
jgi:pectate lyase